MLRQSSCMIPSEYNQRRRERRCIPGIPKFQPAAYKLHFTLHAVIMPPRSIGACWQQADNEIGIPPPPPPPPPSFLYPFPDCAAIGWIHPASACPRLHKPILLLGIVSCALRITRRCTYVKIKVIYRILSVEKLLRCFPLTGRRRKHSIPIHSVISPLPVALQYS